MYEKYKQKQYRNVRGLYLCFCLFLCQLFVVSFESSVANIILKW